MEPKTAWEQQQLGVATIDSEHALQDLKPSLGFIEDWLQNPGIP